MNLSKMFSGKGTIIYGGVALIFLGVSVFCAGKDTVKAVKMKEEEEAYRKERNLQPMTKKETVKLCARAYIPTVVATVTTASCIVASVVTGEKKCAAIGAACTLAETGLRNFQDSAREILSEEDYAKVTERVASRTVEAHPVDFVEVEETGQGNVLFCNGITNGGWFRSEEVAIRSAFNEFNNRLMNEMVMSLDDLYDELHLQHCRPLGSTLVWDISDGLLYPILTETGKNDRGEPYIVMGVSRMPQTKPTW